MIKLVMERKLQNEKKILFFIYYLIHSFFSREQLRKKAEEDLKENINVIRRNLPAKKDGIAGYLSQTTQEIADQIAKNLVDRALELDRKRLVKKLNHPAVQNGAFSIFFIQLGAVHKLREHVWGGGGGYKMLTNTHVREGGISEMLTWA